jgi:hypothetical protein
VEVNDLPYANSIGTNVSYDPRFVNAAAGDFRLCEGSGVPAASCTAKSQAIDTGTNIGLLYNGTAPDLGALESGTSPTPTPTPTPTSTPTPTPSPSGTQLASMTTRIADSNNFSATLDRGVSNLFDSDTTTEDGSTGNAGISSFWVEFDFGSSYNLSSSHLFGDADGTWVCSTWTLEYKQNQTDSYATAFTNAPCNQNQWFIQSLTQTARYVKVTVNSTTGNTQARELQIYGTPALTPTACSQYTPSSTIPTGYASPYDVVSSPSTNLMNVTCDVSSARVDLGKGDPLQYIYNMGYLFKTGGTAWTSVPYTSTESLIAGAWYPKTANTTIALTSTELSQPSYALAYLCTWIGSGWKCGCRDSACTQSYWQIQSFKR